jgi:signal transduction histidine kinase
VLLKNLLNPISGKSYKVPLRAALVVPFTLQVGLAVGLTCYFSLRSGQQSIDQMATQLTNETTDQIQRQVSAFMETPHIVTQINADAVRLGQLDLQNSDSLERHFWQQMQLFPNLRPIAFGSEQGKIHAVDRLEDGALVIRVIDESTGDRYHTYRTNSQGDRAQLIRVDDTFDPRQRPWYTAASRTGEPTWTEIYSYFSSSALAISAVRPLYTETGELLGVTNATLSLSQLSSFLADLEIGRSGQTFIIERSGSLVASSAQMYSISSQADSPTAPRLAAVDSIDQITRLTTQHLIQRFGDLEAIAQRQQIDFEINGERKIVQLAPFTDRYGLDWLVVVVVPEAEFSKHIAANTRSTVLLCLGVLVLATATAALTSEWIAQPILHLTLASKALAEQNSIRKLSPQLAQTIKAKGIHELSVLAQAHNQIAAQLQASLTALEQANEQLELRVEQRTAELQAQTALLHQAFDFEAVLKRITDKVRDSLDEKQILQTVVQELGQGLNADCCNVGMSSGDKTAFTICYEYTTMPTCQGRTFQVAEAPMLIHQQIWQGRSSHCFTAHDTQSGENSYATLACPLLDGQKVLGNLWLFRAEQAFTELEVRLVEQVANQCAIAIRQSRLFQAAQTQVEELKHLHQLKDDFLNTVSHELRTPISNMKLAIHLLKLASTPDRRQQYLDILQSECTKEADLINDLLDLQRLEADHYPVVAEPIVLQDWISDVVKPFWSRSGDRHQTLQVEISDNLPPLISDPNSLERILAELLNNACKYTPANGEICLKISHNSQNSCVSSDSASTIAFIVSNTAEIPAAELSRIFEKFYRIPNADPWKQGGTGLGLALIKKLVEQLGGTLKATSQSGQTTFTVLLKNL